MDIEKFRQHHKEFESTVDYPDELIQFWSEQAELSVSKEATQERFSFLVELATAHYIVLARNNARSSKTGASPGAGGGGVVSSKTIGGVTVSYDTTVTSNQGAADWNRTTYGQIFWRERRAFGLGGYQIC